MSSSAPTRSYHYQSPRDARHAKRSRLDPADDTYTASFPSSSGLSSHAGVVGRKVTIVEEDGGGAARQLVAMMETLDDLHDLILRAPNAEGEMESIRMHRLVLAAASPYAKAMLGRNGVWMETSVAVGEAGDTGLVVDFGEEGIMDIASLQAVASYIYTGTVRVGWGADLLRLARVADYLGLEALTERCVEAVVEGLQHTDTAALEMLMLVGTSSSSSGAGEEWMERVRDASMGYSLRHFASLSQTEWFVRHMGVRELSGLLVKDKLWVEKEKAVFEAVVRWMGVAGMGRSLAEAEALLPLVRFPQMETEYVRTHVLTCQTKHIVGSALLQRLLAEATAYKATVGPRSKMTWGQAVARGLGEESARTRPRVSYAQVDVMTMACRQVVQGMDDIKCLGEVGGWVVSGHSDGSLRVWDVGDTWTCVKTLVDAHDESIQTMTTWQGLLVTAGNDTKVKIWEAGTWKCTQVLEGHTSCVRDVLLLDEHTLLSCGGDRSIRVWDTSTSWDTEVWDASTWTCKGAIDSGHASYGVSPAAHDGMVYCGGTAVDFTTHTVRVIETTTWECVDVLRGHTSFINQLLVWEDKLISASADKLIKVWSTGVTPRQCEHTLEGHTDEVVSMVICGNNLVSGSEDNSFRVWSTQTWACERVLEGPRMAGAVDFLLCTRDGRSLVSGSDGDNTVHVWGNAL